MKTVQNTEAPREATAVQVWDWLFLPLLVEHGLPKPRMVRVADEERTAEVMFGESTDAYTWINMLGCGVPDADGGVIFWSEVAWRGWTVRVMFPRGAR